VDKFGNSVDRVTQRFSLTSAIPRPSGPVKVFSEAQYQAVARVIVVVNNFDRLAVPARHELPVR
jgi:hypothetical protein